MKKNQLRTIGHTKGKETIGFVASISYKYFIPVTSTFRVNRHRVPAH